MEGKSFDKKMLFFRAVAKRPQEALAITLEKKHFFSKDLEGMLEMASKKTNPYPTHFSFCHQISQICKLAKTLYSVAARCFAHLEWPLA